MLYTPMTKLAMRISFEAHKNQVDKGGDPYVYHPFFLAMHLDTEDEICVALLHDVIEDHSDCYSFERLEALGFNPNVMTALRLITHDKSQPMLFYVRKLAENPIARKVKIVDLHHNLMDGRICEGAPLKRMMLYVKCLSCLERYPQGYHKDLPAYILDGHHQRFLRMDVDGQISELVDGMWSEPVTKGIVLRDFFRSPENRSIDLTYYDDHDPNLLSNELLTPPSEPGESVSKKNRA
jgi:hypothetical protein